MPRPWIFKQLVRASRSFVSQLNLTKLRGIKTIAHEQQKMAAAEGSSCDRQQLMIDVDTGIDDAHALMLALSTAGVEVVGVTCVNGNVRVDDVVDNTLRVLQVCQRMDVPLYKGACRSLLGKVSTFDNFKAPAWSSSPVDRSPLQDEHAANAMVRLANQHPGEITLVALGPLTNVALAVNLDPEFPKKLKNVFIMGGNTEARGRVSPCAEFNFFADPEAAHIALGSLKSIRLLPFEVCCKHTLSWDFMEEWTGRGTAKSNFLRDSLEFDVKKGKTSGREGYRTCDGFAMAAVLDPSVATQEQEVYATVELSGQHTRGQMVVDWSSVLGQPGNVRLVMGLDTDRMQTLLSAIG